MLSVGLTMSKATMKGRKMKLQFCLLLMALTGCGNDNHDPSKPILLTQFLVQKSMIALFQ